MYSSRFTDFRLGPVSSTPPQPGQRTFQDISNSPSRAACRKAAITRSSSKPCLRREGERVDAVELMIRSVLDQALDGIDDLGIGRLPEDGEEFFVLVHGATSFEARTGPWIMAMRSARWHACDGAPRLHVSRASGWARNPAM